MPGKTQSTLASDDSKKQSNQFGLGMLMGFFVGFSSYFLFKSDEGEQLREKFSERWEDATQELPAIKDIRVGDLELSELINLLLGTKTPKKERGPGLKIKSSTKTVTKEKVLSPQKFKGV